MEWNFKVLDDNGDAIEPTQPEVDVSETVVEEQVEQPLETATEEVVEEQEVPQVELVEEPREELTLDDDKIMSYLKERYDLKVDSLDDVLRKTEKQELPEDVSKFLEYKRETGRDYVDFMNLQKDWSSVDDNAVLAEYLKETKRHLDSEDIKYLIEEQYSFDEDFDDEKDIKRKKVALKEELYKARQYFEQQKEKYKAPLESSSAELPGDVKEAYDFYNEYKQSTQREQELAEQRAKVFSEKTNSLFNEGFKGFEFDLGEKKQAFVPRDVTKVKEFQSDISNFFAQHLDENGIVKDAAAYHKALFAATNADAMAKYFYEQGRADATGGIVKETKNIDMSVRDNKSVEDGAPKFRIVNDSSDFKLKFK